jgi:hypothetical protein
MWIMNQHPHHDERNRGMRQVRAFYAGDGDDFNHVVLFTDNEKGCKAYLDSLIQKFDQRSNFIP